MICEKISSSTPGLVKLVRVTVGVAVAGSCALAKTTHLYHVERESHCLPLPNSWLVVLSVCILVFKYRCSQMCPLWEAAAAFLVQKLQRDQYTKQHKPQYKHSACVQWAWHPQAAGGLHTPLNNLKLSQIYHYSSGVETKTSD